MFPIVLSYVLGIAIAWAQSADHLAVCIGKDVREFCLAENCTLDRSIGGANLMIPVAVDYDPVEENMYWTDAGSFKIYKKGTADIKQLNNTDKVKTLSEGYIAHGLAVDPVSRLLYVSLSSHSAIMAFDLSLESNVTLLRDTSYEPKGIVLDHLNGTMYWADYGVPGICKAHMDGSNPQTLITQDIHKPLNIALYRPEQNLYWTEDMPSYSRHSCVSTCDTMGRHRRTILNTSSSRYYGIAVDDQHIYLTDITKGQILRVHREKGDQLTVLSEAQDPSGMVLYQTFPYDLGENGCSNNNGACPEFCLPTPDGVTCMPPSADNIQSPAYDSGLYRLRIPISLAIPAVVVTIAVPFAIIYYICLYYRGRKTSAAVQPQIPSEVDDSTPSATQQNEANAECQYAEITESMQPQSRPDSGIFVSLQRGASNDGHSPRSHNQGANAECQYTALTTRILKNCRREEGPPS